MRKTDKKIDNQLREKLTDVCDTALKEVAGFMWLTHKVNYTDFPKSLSVVLVFETNQHLAEFDTENDNTLTFSIHQKLAEMGVKIKNIHRHVIYDTEENCANQHDGNWARRLG